MIGNSKYLLLDLHNSRLSTFSSNILSIFCPWRVSTAVGQKKKRRIVLFLCSHIHRFNHFALWWNTRDHEQQISIKNILPTYFTDEQSYQGTHLLAKLLRHKRVFWEALQMKHAPSNRFTITAEFLVIGALFMFYNTAARKLSAISLLLEPSEGMSCN